MFYSGAKPSTGFQPLWSPSAVSPPAVPPAGGATLTPLDTSYQVGGVRMCLRGVRDWGVGGVVALTRLATASCADWDTSTVLDGATPLVLEVKRTEILLFLQLDLQRWRFTTQNSSFP